MRLKRAKMGGYKTKRNKCAIDNCTRPTHGRQICPEHERRIQEQFGSKLRSR